MRYLLAVMCITSAGCMTTNKQLSVDDTKLSRTPGYQQEIDSILAADAENKRWERVYIHEILVAQQNSDNDAYKFFVIEFLKLPRMRLPEWMKNEPNYVPGPSALDVSNANIRVIVKPKTK